LKKIGVDYAQGHYVGRPVAIEPVMEELANNVAAAAS
jgi:EAL domain-containing protein (putative c-di-GMP-specific phosphodiesterase class I)